MELFQSLHEEVCYDEGCLVPTHTCMRALPLLGRPCVSLSLFSIPCLSCSAQKLVVVWGKAFLFFPSLPSSPGDKKMFRVTHPGSERVPCCSVRLVQPTSLHNQVAIAPSV